ncbi:MAG: sigma-54 dependent transcriptional regulator [Pirellulales bacterium]
MPKLLVVDDEQTICWGLKRMGERIGLQVATASSAEDALTEVENNRPDVIVLDIRLPGMDGLTAIDHFRERLGSVPIIVITAFGDLNTAVQAVRSGAFDYIVKPFELEQIKTSVQRALEFERHTPQEFQAGQTVGDLVGKSAVMQDVFRRIALAAASDANVLIVGESGTGKELAARAIHDFSSRAEGRFVAVNVASLSMSLAESELFGHVRGAFTGADQPRVGLLVQADGGTLFLDEVADIPLTVQVKLLRALEHGEVIPVGSNDKVKTNFRMVSATHQLLLNNVRDGTFRHDLFFRLCAFEIHMPALRQRREDLHELADYFVNQLASETQSNPTPLADETYAELERRDWFGNIRELRNAIEHALILARGGIIMPDHLPASIQASAIKHQSPIEDKPSLIASLISQWAEAQLNGPQETADLYEQLLSIVEPALLEQALQQSGGQYSLAARKLGLHRTTLRRKLDQYRDADE